jgi:hypothetical protein
MAHTNTVADHGLHSVAITDAVEDQSRRLARAWSIVALVVFVGLAVTVGLPHGPDLETWERQAQVSTLVVLAVGTAIAWRWEGIGGSLMLVGAVALGVFAALQHQPLIAFLPATAFLVPAVAFLVAWHRTRTYIAVVTLATILAVVLVSGSLAAQAMYDHGYGAAHPQSELTALPDSAVVWHWSGGVTPTQAVIVARVEDAANAILDVGAPGGALASYPGTETDGVWRFEAADLQPATTYTYTFRVDGTVVPERSGSFTTFADGPTSFTVAAGSCSRLGSNGVVYETILGRQPDLFVVPGDFFYADHMETSRHFTEAFDQTLTQPAQATLLSSVPVAYVWDDHDYGGNDADGSAPTRDFARTAYSTYVPHYPLSETGTINQAFTIGRVRFVMLDTRSERDPKSDPDGEGKTMLGAEQLEWLQRELEQSAERYPLIVLVSSVPWIATAEPGADHWGGYATERRKIADFIAEANNVSSLLMLAGDAHMIAIDDGTNSNYSAAGDVTFPLLHAAALDRPGSVKGGPYSEGTYPGGGQFGLIEVADTGTAEITVRISGWDWTGTELVGYSFSVPAPEVAP